MTMAHNGDCCEFIKMYGALNAVRIYFFLIWIFNYKYWNDKFIQIECEIRLNAFNSDGAH